MTDNRDKITETFNGLSFWKKASYIAPVLAFAAVSTWGHVASTADSLMITGVAVAAGAAAYTFCATTASELKNSLSRMKPAAP